MKAFEIYLDGHKKAVCGARNLAKLFVGLQLFLNKHNTEKSLNNIEYFIDVHGLSVSGENEEEVIKWVRAKLNLESEITVRIIETENPDSPVDKQVIKSRREEFERQRFEEAKYTYLKLKNKYEKT